MVEASERLVITLSHMVIQARVHLFDRRETHGDCTNGSSRIVEFVPCDVVFENVIGQRPRHFAK